MRVIYGLLYYYLWAVVASCILLVFFVPRFVRKFFFNLWDRIYGIILINVIVLADSINTYYQYREILGNRT
jgi:uncharacterized membrane protein